uniref:Microtubule-actin cross-linking factor 1 isoform X13 n=1 Tax=Geotrypetes seraphini TaxID=260995 RepID=A0A6P8RWJ0_GEOSA|nr:microtubule-actin cross-linking factor 1 isoform X13 [Geotrypetes seraphini]
MGHSLGCVKEAKDSAEHAKSPLSLKHRGCLKRKRKEKKKNMPEAVPNDGMDNAKDIEAFKKFKAGLMQDEAWEDHVSETTWSPFAEAELQAPALIPVHGETLQADLIQAFRHPPQGVEQQTRALFSVQEEALEMDIAQSSLHPCCGAEQQTQALREREDDDLAHTALLPPCVAELQSRGRGLLVRVTGKVHGELQKAQVLEEGMTVTVHILDNPVKREYWRALSGVADCRMENVSSLRAMMQPVQKDFQITRDTNLGLGDQWVEEPEGSLKAMWTSSWFVSAGMEELSILSPLVEEQDGYDFKETPSDPSQHALQSGASSASIKQSPGYRKRLGQKSSCDEGKAALGMISDIYVGGESGDMSAKEKLLLWTQKVTAGYTGIKCTNFSSCWSDGKMFNAIIHRYRPDLVDMEKVNIQSNQENLEQAFEIAERLGVTRLLDSEDVDVPSPDEKSVITYVSSIYDAFPKVPEGSDGISAIEVDSRWLEYRNRVDAFIEWIRQHIMLMSDRSFPQNPMELKAVYNRYVHFKEMEIPAKEEEKRQIVNLYKLLEVWIEFGRIQLPQGYHPNDMEEAWGKLILEMLECEKGLRPAVERLELLLQIANKIQNGVLSCEEKLTLARNMLQADVSDAESGQLVQHESHVAMYLSECDGIIRQLQVDLQILQDENYYQVEELAFRIMQLQDDLVALRLDCIDLSKKGQFTTSPLLQPTMQIIAEPGNRMLQTPTASWFRKPMTRAELVAISSSEDEGSLRFVYELLAWVEEMQMKMEKAEWGSDLPGVQSQLEKQHLIHNSVEELGSSLQEARIYEVKMSPNFRTSYSETLNKLQSQYCKLVETSSFRLRHLLSLHDFVSPATAELIWLNEKEEEELAYDWSDNNPNMSVKRKYFTELTLELEQKEDTIQSLQEKAELLSLQNHPAKQTVEAYSAAMQSQWHWIKQLCLCVEQHLKENSAYFQFLSDVHESETYLRNLQDSIKRKYVCDKKSSVAQLEDLLQDSMDEKEQLIQCKSSLASLVGRSKTLIQLKPRTADCVLNSTLPIKALCDYRQIEITVCKNDECVLEDNSQRTKWKVISPSGNEAMIPSVCFIIPPPDKEAIDMANRVEQLYQKVMSLWHQLHVNTKSLISWNYLQKDIQMVQEWTMEKLRSLALGEHLQIMKNLQSHYDDFLEDSCDSQFFSVADRLRLEEEVDSCKEHYRQLLDSIKNEDKDESLARTYISELRNVRLQLEECEAKLARRIQFLDSTGSDVIERNTVCLTEQEKMQEELKKVKLDLTQISDRCNHFLLKFAPGPSVSNLRSELQLLVQKMDNMYGLSSLYLDKLKTVDVLVRGIQEAEALVKGYEVKLCQEDVVPFNLTAIYSQSALLQQWLCQVKEKNALFLTLDEDVSRATGAGEPSQEHNANLQRCKEKASQLQERWQRIQSQAETRHGDLEDIHGLLKHYRECHTELITWIEQTSLEQEMMKPGQAEDSRELSAQLSQQTALVAEIEKNQAKLDECQKFSQNYSSSVKDYELQLMTYRAFVDSQEKSPIKRRRMLSSSDAITQEFMNLRTRYTALVTLTTQHVKYISDALWRLEEEEKVVEEEKQEHVEKVKKLLGWALGLAGDLPPLTKERQDLKDCISEQQALGEELGVMKEQVSDAIRTAQIFLAKHGHKLSAEEREQIRQEVDLLEDTYRQLCSGSEKQLQQLQNQLAKETEQKTLQEQQAACRQKLEDLSDWLSHAERSVGEHEAVGSKGELATLQQSQNSIKGLQQELQSQAASSADTIKALEEFLEENCAKMNPSEMAVLQERLQLVKEQYQTLQQRTETAQKELESAVSAAVQQETEKVKAAEQLDLNKRKIELLLDWVTSLDPVTHIQEVDLSQPLPSDAAALQLSEQYERLKARREELLSQQQDCILATQAAQAFLDREGLGLVPDERQQLQNKVLELKKHYAASLLQSEAQLTWVQSLRDELQKFLHDYGDFEVWLQQSEKKLGDLLQEDGRPEALQPLLCRQASFSEDVISHKGDLRYITKSAQKVVDMEERAKEEEQPAFQSSAAVRLVKDKLEEAARRYTALHSECSKLGSYLQTLLHRYEQFQDGACALQTRLQETGEALEKLLSEAVGSEATVLQKQLMCAKNLQGDLTDDQIKVEKVQKMAQVLLETEGDPVLDGKVIQEATDSILSQFQNLSSQLSEHLHLLEKSVTESQSVQETLEDFLQWIVGTEKNLEEHKLDCVSSTCIQASFAGNRKLKQDIVSRKSSLDATREMVNKFLETADGAAADVPQMKLAELTVRFCKVCERQQEQEAALKELLPKAEQYERLLESLQEFMNSKMPLLASGSQPDQDIVQVSQQIKTLNAEMAEQEKAMTVLEKLVTEFRCCPLQIGSLQHLEKVQSLKNDFLRFQEAARKREAEISSCQEGLTDFRKLVGLMRKWLKEKEGSVPSMDACLRIQELTTRMQCLKALLEEWEGKGAQVELITHTGTELENLIMEVTAVDAQSMTGSSASSVNGYHACKDLTEIQCDVSDVRQRYEDLGKVLQDRKEQMSILLERMQEVQQETAVLLKWLESKEEALSVLDVTPIRAEAVRTQAEKNKAFLGELKETSETVHKIKDALVNLIQNHPNSPEVEKWKEMLQDLDQRWDRANQATAERQQRLEESANQLEIFQTAEAQLRPWLMEKELMMSVLGPLSIDPNMLNAQKQQVQFMLKEFETRKQQHEQLIQAAQGILASPGNIPLSSGHVEEKLRGVREKWEELTTKLDSRSIHIDQAIIKSLKYQQVLQDLSEKIKATGQKLGGQSAISTQPEAVKQQLQETSEIRSDLEELEQAVTEAQVLCDDLANLIGEQYLKDELKKRLETVALPLKGLKDLAGDHMHRLQTALASSQQFQQMFDELRTWLNNKRSQQAQSCPVSAKLERLQSQIQKQEEFQKNLNQHSGSYEMIVAEGESLLLCVQPGEERSTLQNQLLTLRAHWEELVKQATDRHSRLKDCLQKAQKYKQHVEDLLPWVENCKVRVAELKVSFDPVQLEAAFLKAKALQNDVEKRGFLVEKMNSAADTLAEVSETDDCEIREEKARLNQDVDAIVKELHIKVGSIEELSQKLKEFRESLQNIEKKLEGTQHQLEIFEALGSQACSNKNLEKMRAQQEVLSELEPQIVYIKDLIHGLVEDAPDGSDSSQLLNQAEAAQREYGLLKQRVNEVCSVMETKLHGISHFHNHVREIFSQLVDLDDELDSMSAIGRDPDSLHSQIEDIQHFMVKLQKLTSDSKSSEAECRHFLEKEGSLDLLGLKRELETLNKQCSKLTERGRNRQEMLEINLARVKDFYSKLKELKQLLTSLGEAKQLRGLVGTEVDAVNQQLIDFKVFQKEQVEPLQLKLQHVSGLGQGLIQSAEKNCDVHGLEHETEELNTWWNTLNKKVAERVAQLQEALLHCGKFQDALEPLLSWLTDTEELIASQKPPSAEYKVVKAQIQEQKLLQRLLDDRKPTVEMIQTEGKRIAESAEPTDKEKILGQLENLGKRWKGLLNKAAARQKQLEDILVLAKEFHETTEPISEWLTSTEKKLANSEPIGTQTVKIQQQIVHHKALQEDILSHAAGVEQMVRIGQKLTSLVDRSMLTEKLDSVQAWYSEMQDRCCRKAVLLELALSNARLFGEEEMELLNWLAELEDKLRFVSVKDYNREVLQRELADQLALNEEIVDRKKNVEQAIRNGQALLKQTTGEEVLLIQEKLDGIKTRYSEITSISLKALRMLEQAQQLATKFQSAHEELLTWLDKVEEELTSSGRQSPTGEEMAKFQQRQKELKKEVMEYRLVLDTVNEVSSALLALVPWRAREGLDKLVLDANERYRLARDTIEHRVHQIDAAIQRSQQYEQTTEAELAWVAETKRKLLALGPIRLEQDKTTAQLQVQKAFSIDIIRHKDCIDELHEIQEEILGTCGQEQKAILQDKVASLAQQYHAVSQLNSERYTQLERAQVLVNQFWETHEELRPWIEETQVAVAQLPPPGVDDELLKQQQEELRQLRESIAEHKPHIDKLMKIGPQLQDLNPEEGEIVQEKYGIAMSKYSQIKAEVHQRAVVLDEAITQAAQNIEFHDKIEPMLETLETLASRLHMPLLIPAEVDKIKESIGENKNALLELEKLLPSFEALKRRGVELIGRSEGADKDPAAKAIQDKLDQMVYFWEDIRAQVNEREMKLLDVLELAEKFWCDLAALLTTIRDTQDIVHDLESPGIDPSIIKQQIEAAETIKEEADGLHEELEYIRILGTDLIFACGEMEKPEVKKSLDEMNNAWENLSKTWTERLEKLEEAMLSSVQYQDTLQAMFDWLDNAVIKLCDMPAVGTDLNTVKEQLNEMKEFKMEVYQQQIEMEKLYHQGELMLKKAIDETDRELIQEPLTELKHLWENLGEKILYRQHRLEAALLALGQFQHALAEVLTWLTHTEELLDAQKPISGDPKILEVELAKHHVLKNDVLAHQTTVETVNRAGNELLESSAADDANSLRTRLQHLNQSWESVCRKTDDREQQLELALQQAQGFHGEIEDFLQWLSKVENQLSLPKATGGLPETAREQLLTHMELYAAFKANEERYKQLNDKGQLMLLSRTESESNSNAEKNVALLEQKWHVVSAKMEERKLKLEEALNLAIEFQNSMQEFINWLTQAEQSLNVVPPPSLILDTVLFQIDEHKVFVNEVNSHRDQIIELDKMGNQLKFLSQKQDVVLIKNLLVSMQSRWEKVVQRSVDRGRALDDAKKRAKQFHEAWKKLIDWLEDAENHLDSELDISNDPDKIKRQLSKHKEFQKTLGSRQPVYDTTVRTGRSLKEKALLADDSQKLDNLLGEVRDKWDTVCGKSVERQHKLEEALLFSGQFMDALQALVDWLYKVEPQLAEEQPVHGDLDLVMNLMDIHKVFQKELGKRTSSVQALKRSARELIENSRDDTTWVKVQLQELSTRWDTVCKLSVSKQTRLEQALKKAEEFRSAVHALLEWLSEAEQTLRFRGALPEDATALQSLIDTHKDFMKNVEDKRADVNTAIEMGESILAVSHPDSVTSIKHWITIIRARFEEVLTWAKQHQQRLESALTELLANSELLEELLTWIQWAETTLMQQDQEPIPQNIDQVKVMISEHQSFMEEMTRKQPDVDKITKTHKRRTTDPNHAPFIEKSRSSRKSINQASPLPPLSHLSQAETKNPRINQLSARWQQVWLLALERQRKLNDALDRLEELKEFANFDFDIWRKKYMRWMNHKKSRVMDFFRRIDKDQDGKITRQEFIDGILASKFPTTRLEMSAVADIFDRDADGYIDYYEFVAVLHPNKDAYRPTTDADKIEDEVTRQVAQCKCAKRFQVEQIGENKYRFFLGNQFGDSQQLRLVRILRSTVMVRVGGGWMALDEFLVKNDPCRARGRTNLELREKFILPEGVSQGMAPFRSRGRRSKPSSRTASPTRSSSSASQSNHSCTSLPSSPATPASGTKTPQHPSRSYDKPWLVNSKAGTPLRDLDYSHLQMASGEVTPSQGNKVKRPHSGRTPLTGDVLNSSCQVSSSAKSSRADGKKNASRPTSRTGSHAGSRASSRRGSDASDLDLLETQSACSDTSESSATGYQGRSPRATSKPSKIPTMPKKCTTATPAKTPGSKR